MFKNGFSGGQKCIFFIEICAGIPLECLLSLNKFQTQNKLSASIVNPKEQSDYYNSRCSKFKIISLGVIKTGNFYLQVRLEIFV